MTEEVEALKSRIAALESALGVIARLEVLQLGLGATEQLTHVLGVLDSARETAADALSECASDGE